MNLSGNELLVLDRLSKNEDIDIIPDDMRDKFSPETLQLTLTELQSKGLVEYVAGGYTPTKKAQEYLKKIKVFKEKITAWGHPNVLATHETTIEITKEGDLTGKGDCIIAVRADKGCINLISELKDSLKIGNRIKMTISAGNIEDSLFFFGSPALKLQDENCIVIRKSDFIDDRTLGILSNKAAKDLKRDLVEKLKDSKTKVEILLEIR